MGNAPADNRVLSPSLIHIFLGEVAEARAGDHVVVHYTGWLTNGSKFESSKDRSDPFSFPLGQRHVISGWDEGVQEMKIGGTRKLTMPPQLGYGARGAGGAIPPNATLVFEVEPVSYTHLDVYKRQASRAAKIWATASRLCSSTR